MRRGQLTSYKRGCDVTPATHTSRFATGSRSGSPSTPLPDLRVRRLEVEWDGARSPQSQRQHGERPAEAQRHGPGVHLVLAAPVGGAVRQGGERDVRILAERRVQAEDVDQLVVQIGL